MSKTKLRQPDRHWRNSWRFAVAVESAFAGVLVAFTVAMMLQTGGEIDPVCAALLGGGGGLVGGFILSGWYGRPGRAGWVSATLCSLVAPPLAGALAGTCLLPGVGTVVGAGMALWTFGFPQSIAVWATCLIGIHTHIRWLRAEHFPA